ncbi:MAG: hypothetical protein ACC652_09350 [Acidimicrobiales bacterium]
MAGSAEFSRIAGALRRRWWIVLGGGLLGLLMAQVLSSSNVPLLVLGGFVGLGLFAALAFAFDVILNRVASVDDVESRTGSPVLVQLGSEAVRVGNPVMRTQPNSDEAHAYRRLAAAVLAATHEETACHKLMLASADQTAAHAMVATNLALAVEESGKRVVLIAGDRQRNDIDAIFSLEGRDGLQQVLDGTRAVDFVAISPRLSLMPTGRERSFNFLDRDASPVDVGASEDLNSVPTLERVRAMFKSASSWADVVIVDTSPALSYADARVFVELSDSVILSVTTGRTTLGEVSELASMMRSVGVPVLGSVLLDKAELPPAKKH